MEFEVAGENDDEDEREEDEETLGVRNVVDGVAERIYIVREGGLERERE